VSGPVCAFLGARLVGLATLLVNALLFAAAYAGSGVAPFLWVFAASRFSQCFTWVCIPQILSEWFDKSRHGECFGYMSTASRTGIITTTATLYLVGADVSSRAHFAVGAAVMLACGVFFAAVFPTSRGSYAATTAAGSAAAVAATTSASSVSSEANTASLSSIVATAAANPIILMQFAVMMSATPLAEFQSQVPVMLKSDSALAPELVPLGTMLWHVGVRCAHFQQGFFAEKRGDGGGGGGGGW
jgi:sugar phosphate permease